MTHILKTYDAVLYVIGGEKVVADLCDKGISTVSKWRSERGLFPASSEPSINRELKKHGCRAARRLFAFDGTPDRPVTKPLMPWSEARRLAVLDSLVVKK